MITLNHSDFRQVVDIIVPHMLTVGERRLYLELSNPRIVPSIDFSGSPRVAATRIVAILTQYGEVEPGKEALVALLEVIRDNSSPSEQFEIDELIRRLTSNNVVNETNLESSRLIGGPSVVLIHANSDLAIVEDVYELLRDNGYQPWMVKLT